MQGLRKQLPPPNSLVVFEAAARHQNFTHAARELGVSQAAVSRQMRTLEEFLGTPLFAKRGRSLSLTKTGRKFQRDVSPGLKRIARSASQIQGRERSSMVTVTTTPAAAVLWLAPRLMQFRKQNPGIDISVIATDWLIDLAAENIDIALRYGAGNWPGGTSSLLFDEDVFPICSPDYLARHPISDPSELVEADLIHFETSQENMAVWREWFPNVGLNYTAPATGMRFDNYQAMLNATIAGEGVALGCSHLVDKYLEQGSLVRPLKQSFKSPNAFWVYTPDHVPISGATRAFRDHLQKT